MIKKKTGPVTLHSAVTLPSVTDITDAELFRSLAYKDFSFYCEYVHKHSWHAYPYLKPVTDALQDVAEGKLRRLMLFMPPRHGKSMTVSETFASYFIGRHPTSHVIIVSYGDALAMQFGRRNKQLVQQYGKELFDISVSSDQSSKVDWELARTHGGVTSVGIGGSITGRGASLLIIDDPIKNSEEANSITYRNKVWNEWHNTLRTRLEGKFAAVIVVTTRWHHDDLAGRLLNTEYGKVEDWRIISLPAIAERNDLLNRDVGQSLAPQLGYDEKWAANTKDAVGSYTWSALYQQHPSEQQGAIFKRKWWHFYDIAPRNFTHIIQSWDMAFKDKKTSSFVAGQVWAVTDATHIYLLDQVRAHMSFIASLRAVQLLTSKWPATQYGGIYVEDKANGPAIISVLKQKIAGLIAVTPQGSKIARAYAVTPMIEAGNVYLPAATTASWITEYLAELSAFPTAVHDDQVDTTTQALSQLSNVLPHDQQSYNLLKGAVMYG